MRVVFGGQAEMAGIFRFVARLLQRAEHQGRYHFFLWPSIHPGQGLLQVHGSNFRPGAEMLAETAE